MVPTRQSIRSPANYRGWHKKLNDALSKGFEGMRVSGNAFWMEAHRWKEFREYEHELDQSLAGKKMIVMGTYQLHASRAIDLLDVTRVHSLTVARRKGDWEFLETQELRQAREEIKRLRSGVDILSNPFPGHELLTPRERIVPAEVVRGASNKKQAGTWSEPAHHRISPCKYHAKTRRQKHNRSFADRAGR